MRILIGLTLLVSACGPSPCDFSDFYTSGVCVITNGYDIDPDMIDFAVDVTEHELNFRLQRTDTLSYELRNIGASVEYVKEGSSKLGGNNRGITRFAEMTVNYLEDIQPTIQCVEHYYVFVHELLHIVSREILEYSAQESTMHQIPYVFLEWAARRSLDLRKTAEIYIYHGIKSECEARYGEWE